jgi:hypothetical protein
MQGVSATSPHHPPEAFQRWPSSSLRAAASDVAIGKATLAVIAFLLVFVIELIAATSAGRRPL